MKAKVCEHCDHVHGSDWAVALRRFTPGPHNFRARGGGPERGSRAEAVADECNRRRRGGR